MTYGEIYKEFLLKTKIDCNLIEDYRPCCEMFDAPNIGNGIIIWLKSGGKLIYRHEEL